MSYAIPVEECQHKLRRAYVMAVDLMVDTMKDAKNRPKEALQAAKLIIKKVSFFKLFGLEISKDELAEQNAILAEFQALEQQMSHTAIKKKQHQRMQQFLPKR